MIRVVIVDDQPLVREGLRALLDRAADLTVVGEASGGDAGVAAVRRLRPDVVLMDIRMPEGDGLAATAEITADPDLRGAHVVVLTTFDTDENLDEAMRIGAAGFLLKDTSPDQLRQAVRVAASGDALLSPEVTRRVMQAAAERPRASSARRLDELTDRERQVLAEVGTAATNDEIAAKLHVSPATARTHVSRLLAKLRARDRVELVVIAYETGLVTPGQD